MKKKVLRERNKELSEKYWGQLIEKCNETYIKSVEYLLNKEKTKIEKPKKNRFIKKEDK